MTETIRCPGCSTRFALRPERVGAGIRRAKCFKCGTLFDIAETVERLLAGAPSQPDDLGATTPLRVHPEFQQGSAPEPEPEEAAVSLPPSLLAAPMPGDTVNLDVEPPPIPEAAFVPTPLETSPFEAFDAAPPSLTLGDLEGSDEEIMEKTLVILPPPSEPEPFLPDPGASGFTSAKDAIAKLMGDAPAASPSPERRMLGTRNPMDVEATLSALEVTLSGAQAAPAPQPQVPSASTLKLSAAEIQAAIGSAPMRLPDMPAPAPAPLGPPPMARPVPQPSESSSGADLLKVQLEQETLENLTIEQMTALVEQGRVKDWHMVARQYSDNWIEALKVPALRPVFERRRREEIGLTEPPSPPEMAPPKRSLFGGLFGRN